MNSLVNSSAMASFSSPAEWCLLTQRSVGFNYSPKETPQSLGESACPALVAHHSGSSEPGPHAVIKQTSALPSWESYSMVLTGGFFPV